MIDTYWLRAHERREKFVLAERDCQFSQFGHAGLPLIRSQEHGERVSSSHQQ